MDSFTFSSPLLPGGKIRIKQESSREIGFKLYPAALLLCKFIERAAMASTVSPGDAACAALAAAARPDATVVELGAGVCGLPSLLFAALGARAVATDLGDGDDNALLSTLRENVCSAGVRVEALRWGSGGSAAALATRLAAPARTICACSAGGRPVRAIDLIVGADVVYHEELIAPLLETLVELTTPSPVPAGACKNCIAATQPPAVVLAYVQRFKRAKMFWKRATRWFDVERVAAAEVIDYQELSWQLPRLLAHVHGAGSEPTLSTSAASFTEYVAAMQGASAVLDAAATCGADAAVAPASTDLARLRSTSSLSDCSSEDEARAWRGMAQSGGGTIGGSSSDSANLDSLCQRLGVPAVRPTAAAIYVLRRRTATVA